MAIFCPMTAMNAECTFAVNHFVLVTKIIVLYPFQR